MSALPNSADLGSAVYGTQTHPSIDVFQGLVDESNIRKFVYCLEREQRKLSRMISEVSQAALGCSQISGVYLLIGVCWCETICQEPFVSTYVEVLKAEYSEPCSRRSAIAL